jgi:histidyl-tRNA synthetase
LDNSGAPMIRESLCDDCLQHMGGLKEHLDALDIQYTQNDLLVRGLDYYTRTAWEVTIPGSGAVSGGGRYDSMVEQVGGPVTPAIGFAGGIERALELVLAQAPERTSSNRPLDVFVVVADDSAEVMSAKLLALLRQSDLSADRDYQGKSVKSQFKQADRAGARFVAVLGDAEMAANTVTLKNLSTGEQQSVPYHDIIALIGKEGLS